MGVCHRHDVSLRSCLLFVCRIILESYVELLCCDAAREVPELNEAEVARIRKARENKPWDVAELLLDVSAAVGACVGSLAGKFVTIFKFCYLWSLLLGFSTLLFVVLTWCDNL